MVASFDIWKSSPLAGQWRFKGDSGKALPTLCPDLAQGLEFHRSHLPLPLRTDSSFHLLWG